MGKRTIKTTISENTGEMKKENEAPAASVNIRPEDFNEISKQKSPDSVRG